MARTTPHHEGPPLFPAPEVAAEEDFARDERRNEPLKEVTDLVVGVPGEAEPFGEVEAERDPRIGVHRVQLADGPP